MKDRVLNLFRRCGLLSVALAYTAAALVWLCCQRIVNVHLFTPLIGFFALLAASLHAPDQKGVRHLRWLGPLFFLGFLSHFYLCAMSSGAFYAQVKFIGLLNVLFHTGVYLLVLAGTGSLRAAVAAGGVLFGVLGIANHYVWLFRGAPIGLEDLTSIKTAVGVAGNYNYTPDQYIVLLGGMMALWTVAIYRRCGAQDAAARPARIRKTTAIVTVALFASLPVFGFGKYYSDNANTFNYHLYFADVLATLCQKGGVEIPDYYSAKAVELIADNQPDPTLETEDGVKPNIVAIMSESYGDLRVLGDFQTNIEVTPFMDSLRDDPNTVTGFAYASVFGSKTANSEFEFLSSDSTLYIPDTMVYLHYFDNLPGYDSLVSVLDAQGYTTAAMHPYLRAGWNRPAVYGKMGFDEAVFLEDMKDVQYYRQYPSDDYNFSLIRHRFDNKKPGEPLFLFDITMQNHGGYEGGGNGYEQTVRIAGHEGEFPKAEMYLSEQHESDKALRELIEYFSQYDEPTAVIFFGDHQPKLDGAFYQWLDPAMSSDPEQAMKKQMVPFFIWCNYDIEPQRDVRTSLNYLAPLALDTLGLPMSDYQNYLLNLRQTWPVICAEGVYDYTGAWHDPQQALENSALLREYQELTINHTVDGQNTVREFFRFGGARVDPSAVTGKEP